MNNQNQKYPITKTLILSFVSGIAFSVAVILLGMFFGNQNCDPLLWKIPTCILSMILTVKLYRRYLRFYVYNFLKNKNMLRLRKRKINTCTDATKLYRKLKVAHVIAIVYYVLIVTLACMSLFFRACFGMGISMLIGFYILFSISYMFYYMLLESENHELKMNKPENLISRQEYPFLYEMAEEVKNMFPLNKKLNLYITEQTTSVDESLTEINILLNVVDVAILTKEELKTILMHEFAHVFHGDTKHGWIYSFIQQLTFLSIGNKWKSLAMFLFSEPLDYVQRCKYRYQQVISKSREELADKKMLEIGDAQIAANALGKWAMYKVYLENSYMHLNPDMSQVENVSNHPEQERIEDFKRELTKNEEEWRSIVESEIPQEMDSHQTLKERIHACNVSNYDVHTKETDEDYKKEIEKLVNWKEQVFQSDEECDFNVMREEYERRIELIETFQKEEHPYENFSVGELYEFADAFQVTNDDKAMEILDVILKKVPKHTLASALKGEILLRLGKEEGLEYLFDIMENHEREIEYEYIELLYGYACRYGRKDALERCKEIRNRISDDIDQWEETVGRVNKDDVLYQNKLSVKQMQRINHILQITLLENIKEVLYVQKKEEGEVINLYFTVCEHDSQLAPILFAATSIRSEMVKEMNNVVVQNIKKSDKIYQMITEQVPDCCIYKRES